MANYASKVIKVALNEVGYLEKETSANLYSKTANAGDENYNKYAYEFDTKYYKFYNGKKNGYAAWCDIFVDWCLVKAFGVYPAMELLGQPLKSYGAGCTWSVRYYKNIGRFYITPKIGDQIFFKDSSGDPCHTGIVYDVDGTYVYTVEGNTSSKSGVVANGGAVAMKKYKKNYNRIYGYGRPKYDTEVVNTPKPVTIPSADKNAVLKWQKAAMADGYKPPKYFAKFGADGDWGAECIAVASVAVCQKQLIGYKNRNLTKIVQKAVGLKGNDIDGKFGNDTKNAVVAYQKKNGLTADGIVGLNTWKKILGVK